MYLILHPTCTLLAVLVPKVVCFLSVALLIFFYVAPLFSRLVFRITQIPEFNDTTEQPPSRSRLLVPPSTLHLLRGLMLRAYARGLAISVLSCRGLLTCLR
jgi:hypothetical protein